MRLHLILSPARVALVTRTSSDPDRQRIAGCILSVSPYLSLSLCLLACLLVSEAAGTQVHIHTQSPRNLSEAQMRGVSKVRRLDRSPARKDTRDLCIYINRKTRPRVRVRATHSVSAHTLARPRDIFTNCQSSIAAGQIASNEADARGLSPACPICTSNGNRRCGGCCSGEKAEREQSKASFALIVRASTCASLTWGRTCVNSCACMCVYVSACVHIY